MNAQETIVKFKIGRGGQFNNGGHLTFVDCSRIDSGSDYNNLFLNKENTEYVDGSGNSVGLTVEESKSGIGRIDQDGIYDTIYTIHLSEIDMNEYKAIKFENPYNYQELLDSLLSLFDIKEEEDLFMHLL